MSSKAPIRLLIMAVVQEQDIDNATNAAESLGAPVARSTSCSCTTAIINNRIDDWEDIFSPLH